MTDPVKDAVDTIESVLDEMLSGAHRDTSPQLGEFQQTRSAGQP